MLQTRFAMTPRIQKRIRAAEVAADALLHTAVSGFGDQHLRALEGAKSQHMSGARKAWPDLAVRAAGIEKTVLTCDTPENV
jgi:hypothetical protein